MQLNQEELTCVEMVPGIGIGFSASQGWLPLRDHPLLILVGLTGVGKSTVTSCLSREGLDFYLLPNRRTLTDRFIIPTIIKMEQAQEAYPFCRVARFYYTSRYKQLFPAGMVHVLSQLQFHSLEVRFPLIFDGLRGEDEISYATKILPKAQFVLLEAPEYVRLQRLLVRNDSFDRVTKSMQAGHDIKVNLTNSFADLGVPEASNIFSSEQTAEIFAEVRQGVYSVSALRDRLMILVEEGRSYNPSATRTALQKLAPERTLVIDTTTHSPEQIAQKIMQFIF
ncbi:AAA family ATPase [Aetokthonos hydrillicola Thurmond2011]|jgi:hypothetical protein|uniref:AAA family ATPase n=1 Tax=Aetokthonos hydrillicola Thurmond2011 TaxID=2712845 RepID=A0AAP5MAJ3_9CYAN|nr:AAA family ATPase [Aetokthonos hydrillicola]MBO3461659.1 AAA family ATPase [Aetokthonos hydrillicola CCALA 1050]MBW4588728.1 AAA family ATPase [Aetokthonos hydrillicola CCALA 1050]MDR9895938.1 AAA family ATPase [Aetokthonos hydrillicola Thurmond2011]